MRQASNPRPSPGASTPHRSPDDRLQEFLDACGGVARKSGPEHIFRCPNSQQHTHGDATPSGSVRLSGDGALLVICRAGCDTKDVAYAIGWTMADLRAPKLSAPTRSKSKPKSKKVYANLADLGAAAASTKKGRLESAHVYHDGKGAPALAVIRVRLPDGSKEIPQARPAEGGWVFGGIGNSGRPLYNLPEILAASPETPLLFVEGEQKADLLTNRGFLATTTSQGAGKAKLSDFAAVNGRTIYLLADNDEVGACHMDDVARRARAAGAASVARIKLPDLPPKGDIVDFVEARRVAGLSVDAITEEIRGHLASASVFVPDAEDDAVDDDEVQKTKSSPGGDTIADIVVAMARDAELFHSEQGEQFATIESNGHRETWRIESSSFKQWLSSQVFRAFRIAVPPQAMTTAISLLSAQARFAGTEEKVHMRVARIDEMIWLDLCDADWRAVEITAARWRVVDAPAVRFIRGTGARPLPIPKPGAQSIDALLDLFRLDDRDTRMLVTAWLVTCIARSTSYPILTVTGEQGSGKSTFCRALQRCIDPHRVEGRSPPRNEEDIAVAAQHAHVLIYENLSTISPTLSDALCRVATGAGFAGRKLFTNDEERQLAFCRPVIINGIGDLATRSDLADRVVSVHLDSIAKDGRQTEASLWRQFELLQPHLIGALLDLVSKVLATPDIDVRLERMAEYSQLGAKVAVALGQSPSAFTEAYRRNRDRSSLAALDASAVGSVILRMVQKEPIRSPMGMLLNNLVLHATKPELRHPEWPDTARGLGNELRRIAPNLGRIGVEVQFLARRSDGIWVAIERASGDDLHDVHDVHPDTPNT